MTGVERAALDLTDQVPRRTQAAAILSVAGGVQRQGRGQGHGRGQRHGRGRLNRQSFLYLKNIFPALFTPWKKITANTTYLYAQLTVTQRRKSKVVYHEINMYSSMTIFVYPNVGRHNEAET